MKLYYSIGEVANMLGVNTSLLRFWETEFPQIKPTKNERGSRRYTERDINLLRRIYHLTKECGYTLDGARYQLRQADNTEAAISRLIEAKQQLVALRQELANKRAGTDVE